MVQLTLRIPEELHEKIRWLAYKERRSQQTLILEALETAFGKVVVPSQEGQR